ncbi:Succinate dehydrogenase assembly factor 2 mitochondrial [Coemansia sp. RSA 2611]|nr:Succinate dehydrogenase assembly factor 2 mitochondrial [Coemansia sp. RSA 2611]
MLRFGAARRAACRPLTFPHRRLESTARGQISEDSHTMRRRLLYQMRKRGILETDLLLSSFAARHLADLPRADLDDLDALLANVDWDIFHWASGKTAPPPEIAHMPVFQKLRDHAARRGASIVRMPDLPTE